MIRQGKKKKYLYFHFMCILKVEGIKLDERNKDKTFTF